MNDQPTQRSRWEITLWLILAALVLVIAGVQQGSQNQPTDEATAQATPGPPSVMLDAAGRYAVGIMDLGQRLGMNNPEMVEALYTQAHDLAQSRVDQLCLVILTAELHGPDTALADLDALEATLDHAEPIRHDAHALRTIYTRGADQLDTDRGMALMWRYGWFGRLALSHDAGPDHPLRVQVMRQSLRAAMAVVSALALAGLAALAGLILFVVAIVLLATGVVRLSQPLNPADTRPEAAPAALLESFVIFLLLILVLSMLAAVLEKLTDAGFMWVVMAGSPLAVFWPLMRGWSWAGLRQALGWHRGRGLAREACLGVIGYVAGLPIIGAGVLVTAALLHLTQSQANHPIVRDALDLSPAGVARLYLLACVWAPLVEETMFRGALYHHTRRHLGVLASAALVGVIFAAVHPQGWAAIPALGSIGLVLALLRQWRGSLTAPIFAHALNNAFVVTLLVMLVA